MKNLKIIFIIFCSVLILIIVWRILYFCLDGHTGDLSEQERLEYQKVVSIINDELKEGKSTEQVVDLLRKDSSGLEIMSITPISVGHRDETVNGKLVRHSIRKGFGVSCKVHSVFGVFGGSHHVMSIEVDEQNKTAESFIADR